MLRSNEELAVAFQRGDREASAELLAQNQGLLTRWARAIQEQYGLSDVLDDLVQEGRIALLQASAKYDPARDVKLMSFTGSAIRQAMQNCAASLGSVVSMPISRLRQIRATRYFAVQAPMEWNREQMEEMVAEKMGLSPSVIRTLLAQGEALLTYEPLEEQKQTPSEYGNPESVYEEKLLFEHLSWLIETMLTVREQTLVRHYFGLGADTTGGMTLEELAIHLNYKAPAGHKRPWTGRFVSCGSTLTAECGADGGKPKGKLAGLDQIKSGVLGLNCGR